MSEKYTAVMERIQVTEAMRRRILANLRNVGASPAKRTVRYPHIKRYLSVAACLLIVAAAVLVGRYIISAQQPAEQELALGYGVIECADNAELVAAVGFDMPELAKLPFTADTVTYCSVFGSIAEIDYEGGGQSAVFRKSVGSEDNSGYYDDSLTETELDVNGTTVTLKGNDGVYILAIWQDDTYSYSLYLSEGGAETAFAAIITGLVQHN